MTGTLSKPHRVSAFVRRVRAAARRGWDLAFPARGSADLLIIREVAGDRRQRRGSALVLFASYDSQSRVDPYVLRHLKALVDEWDADVQFVTTSERLSDEDIDRLRPFCRTIIHRRNVGLDFGSWRVALERAPDWRLYECAILANDSVYGPLWPFERIQRLLLEAPAGRPRIVGVTENGAPRPHLQSYFLAFNRAAIVHPFFAAFWSKFRFYRNKTNTIYRQEIGLSRRAARAGFELVALCPYESSLAATRARGPESLRLRTFENPPVNPTHELWRSTLLDFKCPYVKGELLKLNPRGVEDLRDLPGEIARSSDYPWSLVQAHLDRLGLCAVPRSP